jgi:lantibiotic biosynthesis protein
MEWVHCGADVLLRAPVWAWADAERGPVGDVASVEALTEFLSRPGDPLFEEAVAVSSPSLAATIAAVRAGRPAKPGALRRAAGALARYQLRGASRSTPFGLFAGIALLGFGDRTSVDVGLAHRRAVGLDQEWLTGLLADWERRPEVRRVLRVVANNLAVVRGDRVIVSFVVDGEGAGIRSMRERSVRHTPVVRAVLACTARPVRHGELCAEVARRFPGTSLDRIDALIGQLIAVGVLLTELRPSVEGGDAARHALALLRPVADGLPEDVRTQLAELEAITVSVAHYAATSPTAGTAGMAALTELTGRMKRLRPAARNLLTVDLALDASGRVHRSVGDELCRVAELLYRLTPDPTPEWLRDYHLEFIERYGVDRLVPLVELLDSELGLGAPAAYAMPRDEAGPTSDPDRDAVLGELAMGALLDNDGAGREVVLDEAVLGRLGVRPEGEWPEGERPEAHFDLCAELVAEDAAAVDRGEFRIVLHPWGGSLTAGAMFGRFAHPLGQPDLLERITEGERVRLAFQPRAPRLLNLVDNGLVRGERIVLGAFHDPGDPEVRGLDDLLVGADGSRLRIVSRATGETVHTATYHMLNPYLAAPDLGRFLQDVTLMGSWAPRPWQWGALSSAPFLPRVRYGRTVLAPATWRLTDPALRDPRTDWADWQRRFAAWRERWQVPSAVRIGGADQRIRLDLDREWHRRLLREDVLGSARTTLSEDSSLIGLPGWLRGAHRPATAEIVVPLHATTTRPRPPEHVREPLPPRRTRPHLPGGEWLYAKLYVSAHRQDDLLAGPVADLASRLPDDVDRWFFIRYTDPDPHLRLRFHGDPAALTGKLLGDLHDWAAELIDVGLTRRVELAAYDPETERYGGPEAIGAAESVFHADTMAVLAQLRTRAVADSSAPYLICAANIVDIARHLLGETSVADWLCTNVPKSEPLQALFRTHRTEALALIPSQALEPASVAADELPLPHEQSYELSYEIWRARVLALRAYGARLREIERGRPGTFDTALSALLHMHHNRLIGIDRESERRAMAIARGAVDVHAARKRAGAR